MVIKLFMSISMLKLIIIKVKLIIVLNSWKNFINESCFKYY